MLMLGAIVRGLVKIDQCHGAVARVIGAVMRVSEGSEPCLKQVLRKALADG